LLSILTLVLPIAITLPVRINTMPRGTGARSGTLRGLSASSKSRIDFIQSTSRSSTGRHASELLADIHSAALDAVVLGPAATPQQWYNRGIHVSIGLLY